MAFDYLNFWFLYLYFFNVFIFNAAWPHNSFTKTPGCLLLHQNFTFINNILSSSTNLYAAFCLLHFHLLFDYITANASKTSKPFSKINSRTATSTPEPPPTWAVLAAATPPDNHTVPLVSCWCFLRRRVPADAAWIFFSTLLREEGPPPPSLHPPPGRQVGWVLFCPRSSGVFMRQLEIILDMDFLFIYLFWHLPLLLTPTRLLWRPRNSIFPPFVLLPRWQELLSSPSALPPLKVTWESHLKKNRTTCCYLISFLVRRGAHSFTSLGRICWIQPISSLLKIYSGSSQNEETAGVPADANSSWGSSSQFVRLLIVTASQLLIQELLTSSLHVVLWFFLSLCSFTTFTRSALCQKTFCCFFCLFVLKHPLKVFSKACVNHA